MDVDPPGSLTDAPAAPSTSNLKRPQTEEMNDASTAAKRAKPEQPENAPAEGVEDAEAAKEQADKRVDGKKGQKQKGKKGKDKEFARNRRRGTRTEGEEVRTPDNGEPKAPRLPKRACALLIGFCGDGYNGMQMCVSMSTRECTYKPKH